jgi:phosphopantetheine adenylyltransferase
MLKNFDIELAKIIFEYTNNDENSDAVAEDSFVPNDDDILYRDQKIAIVPGSFKPPHKGHWEMVMNYVNKVDKVIVLISNISFKAISERSLSLSNLKQFGKIKQFAIDNNIINDEIKNVFNEIESITDGINFVTLKGYLENLIDYSKNIKDVDIKYVKKFQLMTQTYLNKLNETLFKSIRKAGSLEITPETSKGIFEIYAKAYGVENKVDIIVPDSASPITATVGFINYNCKDCEVLLGVSTKGGDEARWNGIEKSIKNKTVNVIPAPVNVETMLSATDLRNNINNLKKEYFPDKLTDNDLNEIKQILGVEK